MPFDTTDVVLSLLKIVIVLVMMLQITPIMVWIERRGSALIQDRPGPNRIGPFGLLQSLIDALKFILKEDIIPSGAHKWLYTLAPVFGLIPALTTIAVVPWGRPFTIPRTISDGGALTSIGWTIAGLLLLAAFLAGGASARYTRKPAHSRFNTVVGWLVVALCGFLAFVIGALLLTLHAVGTVTVPAGG